MVVHMFGSRRSPRSARLSLRAGPRVARIWGRAWASVARLSLRPLLRVSIEREQDKYKSEGADGTTHAKRDPVPSQ